MGYGGLYYIRVQIIINFLDFPGSFFIGHIFHSEFTGFFPERGRFFSVVEKKAQRFGDFSRIIGRNDKAAPVVLYQLIITGNIGDALIVAPAARGVANLMVNAAGLVGAPQGLILCPGIIAMITAAANDADGDIDWTCLYYRIAATGGGAPAPTDGITVL